MLKRAFAVLTAATLAGSLISAGSVQAADPVVPAAPNIVDPKGDARLGLPAGPSFTGADIQNVWFTHDKKNLYAHVQTTTNARVDSIMIDVGFDPGKGAACMYIDAVTEGAENDARVELFYEDECGDETKEVPEGTFTMTPGPDDTTINTISVPRKVDPAFKYGAVLKTPYVTTWNNAGDLAYVGRYDTTDPGTDYVITPPKKKKRRR